MPQVRSVMHVLHDDAEADSLAGLPLRVCSSSESVNYILACHSLCGGIWICPLIPLSSFGLHIN